MSFVTTQNSNFSWVAATATLASAVAASGTVTIAYPSGTNQAYFTGVRATTTGQLVIRNNNEVFDASKAAITYGSSDITITNNSGFGWAIGDALRIQLAYVDTAPGFRSTKFTLFTGVAAAGAVTLAAAVVGQRVVGVVNTTDGADAASSFEGVISVAGQIQQTSASDLSAKKFLVLLGQPL